jgi:hypothetical protein
MCRYRGVLWHRDGELLQVESGSGKQLWDVVGVAWKGLWPVLQDHLLKLFQNSLSEAYLPRALETGEDYITP